MSREHIAESRNAITSVADYDDRNQEHGQNAVPEDEHLQALPTIRITRPSSDRLSFGEMGNVYRAENHRSRNVPRPRFLWHRYSGLSMDNIPTRYEDRTPPPSLINASVQSGGLDSRTDAKEFFGWPRKTLSRVVADHYRAVSDPISSSLSNTFGSIRRRIESFDKRTSRPTSPVFAAGSDTPRLMPRKLVRNRGQDNEDSPLRDEDECSALLGAASRHPEKRPYMNAAHLSFSPILYPIDAVGALYSQPNRTFYHTVDKVIVGEGNATGLPNIIQQSSEDVHFRPRFLPQGQPSTELRETRVERPSMAANLWRIAGRAEKRNRQYRTPDSSHHTGQFANPPAPTDRQSNSIDALSTDAYLMETTSKMSIYEENSSDLPNLSGWNTAPSPVPPHHISPSAADTNFKSHLIGHPNPFWHPDDDEQDSQNDSDSASSSASSLRDCDSNLEDQPERYDGCDVADVEIGRVAHDCVSAPIPFSETEFCGWKQEMDSSSESRSLLSLPESWSVTPSEGVLGCPDPSFASLDVSHRQSLPTNITLPRPSVVLRSGSGWLSRFWDYLRDFHTDGSDLDLPYQHLPHHEPAASRTTSFLDAIHDQLFSPPVPYVISDPGLEDGSDKDPITYAQADHMQDSECTPEPDLNTYEEQVPSMTATVEGLSFHAQAQLEETVDISRQGSQPTHTTGNPDSLCQEERAAVESPTTEYDRGWNETPPVTIDHAYSTDGSETWRDCSIFQWESVNQCLDAEQRRVMPLAEKSLCSHGPIGGQWKDLSYPPLEDQHSIIAKTRQPRDRHEFLDRLFDERGPVRRPRIAKSDFRPTPRIIHYNSPLTALLHLPSINLDEFMNSHKIGRSAAGIWAQPRTTFPAESKSMTSRLQGARPGWLTKGHSADDVARDGGVCASAEKQQQDGNKTHPLVPSLPSIYSTWQCGLPGRFAGHWAPEQDRKSAGSSSYSGVIALRHAGRRSGRTTAANVGVYNGPCDT